MKICALYKTFRGEEFVRESLASIYEHVDSIVMIHSRTGWDGQEGNTVANIAEEWTRENDYACKIIHYYGAYSTQDEQYQGGMDFIQLIVKPDWIMLIDTDEVWEYKSLMVAKRFLPLASRYKAIHTRLYTYVKDVQHRISPPEMLTPTIFVRGDQTELKGVRGNEIKPNITLNEVYFHHFSYVRDSFEKVAAKIHTSSIGDGLRTVDLKKWKKEKWDKLESATNFHTSVNFAQCWKGVEHIDISKLPKAIQNKVIQTDTRLDNVGDVEREVVSERGL